MGAVSVYVILISAIFGSACTNCDVQLRDIKAGQALLQRRFSLVRRTEFLGQPAGKSSRNRSDSLQRQSGGHSSRPMSATTSNRGRSGNSQRSSLPELSVIGPAQLLDQAEGKAKQARLVHKAVKQTLSFRDNQMEKEGPWRAPEKASRATHDLIYLGKQVADKQQERGYAYSDAAKVAGQVKDPGREGKNSKKAMAAFAGADARRKEMALAEARHWQNEILGSGPIESRSKEFRDSLYNKWYNYEKARKLSTYLRKQGGKDSDSSDSESEDQPTVASVHGLPRKARGLLR